MAGEASQIAGARDARGGTTGNTDAGTTSGTGSGTGGAIGAAAAGTGCTGASDANGGSATGGEKGGAATTWSVASVAGSAAITGGERGRSMSEASGSGRTVGFKAVNRSARWRGDRDGAGASASPRRSAVVERNAGIAECSANGFDDIAGGITGVAAAAATGGAIVMVAGCGAGTRDAAISGTKG